jgi:hypothetical protein
MDLTMLFGMALAISERVVADHICVLELAGSSRPMREQMEWNG